MNTGPVTAASCFTAFALVCLLYLFFTKKPLFAGSLKNFFRAGTAVYLSGTLLILLFAFVLKGVPLAFILISELTIMTVFAATFIIIIRLSKTLAKLQNKSVQKTEREDIPNE